LVKQARISIILATVTIKLSGALKRQALLPARRLMMSLASRWGMLSPEIL
jgi:hypothetical protein